MGEEDDESSRRWCASFGGSDEDDGWIEGENECEMIEGWDRALRDGEADVLLERLGFLT